MIALGCDRTGPSGSSEVVRESSSELVHLVVAVAVAVAVVAVAAAEVAAVVFHHSLVSEGG